MNVDDLKREVNSLNGDWINDDSAESTISDDLIDYLASRGYLATQQPADAVEVKIMAEYILKGTDSLRSEAHRIARRIMGK